MSEFDTDLVLLRGEVLSLRYPREEYEALDEHSFGTVAQRDSESEHVTVTLRAERTHLRIDGIDTTFDGFRYFRTDFRGDPRDPEDATVDLKAIDGIGWDGGGFPEDVHDSHAVRNMTVGRLIGGLQSGVYMPLPSDYPDFPSK